MFRIFTNLYAKLIASAAVRVLLVALAAADERSFPVVEVPIPVPFMAIAQEVRTEWMLTGSARDKGRGIREEKALP